MYLIWLNNGCYLLRFMGLTESVTNAALERIAMRAGLTSAIPKTLMLSRFTLILPATILPTLPAFRLQTPF
ncbi:hypothetical protein CUMW_178560 [Citrus unshiu]|uniref:Uncharacterized protein n=1 Tax=Citrus unshiu TaxID=55188 RepID=A0A2H5PYA6_CITUN|nr:hypothetical protein CUMW_178560 [Citrus unshiu]